MNRQPMTVKSGQVPPLSVLGTEVRFLCEAGATGNAWSLMEVIMPRNSGPPLHTHDWDEAYYIIEGEVQFTIGAQSVLAATGDFLYTPAGIPHGFHGVRVSTVRFCPWRALRGHPANLLGHLVLPLGLETDPGRNLQ